MPPGEPHPDADAALELVQAAGIILDPWQKHVLKQSLRQRDGKWAAFEVGLVCPRQNGKNELLVARELAGLYLLRERLIIHSAHQFDTSKEAFARLVEVIEANDWLLAEVRRRGGRVVGIKNSHGEEGIVLSSGHRIRFRTRTKGGGRGFTADCLIFDEAMILPETSLGAVLPVVSARPNPQVWYTGSAVDQFVHEDGIVLARVRERGLKGGALRLAYFEWSHDAPNPDDVPDLFDRAAWAQANPALGIRIEADRVEAEVEALGARTFAVERLGVGDWPRVDGLANAVISPEVWKALIDPDSEPLDPVVFTFDVNPDRSSTSIAATGRRQDGLFHTEIIARERGTGWVTEWLSKRVKDHRPAAVACDDLGPAKSLVPELLQAGVEVETLSSHEHAQACGFLYDTVAQKGLRHLGTPELTAALRGAATRPLNDAWAWSRKNSNVDISPLVACTLGLWVAGRPKSPEPMVRFT